MGKEHKFGQMVLGMKDFGEKIKLMEKGNFGMLMGTSSKENGKMTKQMDLESILT